ncbi:hypothetical protein [Devosia sp. UYZn731]|uniref:hypothetical protein n=1 Tax=Devosia sp. UYZn731 TaxID=3156345 RepID=UPI00339423D4
MTTAESPENAAELILHERLIRFGRVRDLRAKVIVHDLSDGAETILLYRPAKPA